MSQPTTFAEIDPDERDRKLIELLGGLTDDRRAGRQPDLDAAAKLHPELAVELRELWAAASIADVLARDSSSDQTGVWESSPRPPFAFDDSSQLFGNHELLEELGRGGMGVVHRARQLHLNRIVALKRLLHGPSSRPEDVARFRAEAASAARLSHPNVVAVHDVGEVDGQPFLVMQYVEGTTLARRLLDGPLPPGEAAALLAPICRGVEHAHERGVLHRDLKPSNILIDLQGQPLVSDFGLAKQIDLGAEAGLTETGAILGTPSYMAPEQAASHRGAIGPPTDVYSLGAILYQMLTGRPPFQAASPLDTILLVLEQDPVPPRVLNPKADPDLEMVALKCLQKPPELRYPSAAALADDIDAYLAGKPVSARSTSFRALAGRYLGETPHAVLLENWGELWMYHSVALIVFYGLTYWLMARGVTERWPYFAIFTVGLGTWAAIFWELRRKRGPVTFVERQLAHIWGAGVVALNLVLVAEWLMGLPVMGLAPLLAITNGMLFLVKAGILSGEFYVCAGLLFLTLIPAALHPPIAIPIFALVSAGCFFATGLKYHLRHLRTRRLGR
jgi:eukaryotic-like serine/threonine-protein kinase